MGKSCIAMYVTYEGRGVRAIDVNDQSTCQLVEQYSDCFINPTT